jgi:hypothetical protein
MVEEIKVPTKIIRNQDGTMYATIESIIQTLDLLAIHCTKLDFMIGDQVAECITSVAEGYRQLIVGGSK